MTQYQIQALYDKVNSYYIKSKDREERDMLYGARQYLSKLHDYLFN